MSASILPLAPSAAPTTYPKELAPHACGYRRNPFLGGRDDCPNNAGGNR